MSKILSIYNDLNNSYEINDPRIVGWSNDEAYRKRVEVVNKHFKPSVDDSVFDYGCGSMLSYYKEFHPSYYVGYDINNLSLRKASEFYNIPFYDTTNLGPVEDVYLTSTMTNINRDFTKIVVNGVLQDFDSVQSATELISDLCSYLTENGEIFIITPSNIHSRCTDDELLLSPYDLVSIALSLNRSFSISYGSLGQHMIFKLGGKL